MRILNTSSLALVFGLLTAAPLVAQGSPGDVDDRVLTSATMDAVSAAYESAVDEQRAELAQLLSQPEVQELALDRGIDIERVQSAAAGLSNNQMKQISPLVAKAAPVLQQGGFGSVTISVAAIIVILLLLILLT